MRLQNISHLTGFTSVHSVVLLHAKLEINLRKKNSGQSLSWLRKSPKRFGDREPGRFWKKNLTIKFNNNV